MDADRLLCPSFQLMKTEKSVDKDLPVASLHVKFLKDWFQELMKNAKSFTEQSVFAYRQNGLHCMSDFEIYFLPAVMLNDCATKTLARNKMRFPPRLLDKLKFKTTPSDFDSEDEDKFYNESYLDEDYFYNDYDLDEDDDEFYVFENLDLELHSVGSLEYLL